MTAGDRVLHTKGQMEEYKEINSKLQNEKAQGLWTSKRISKPWEGLRNKKKFSLSKAGSAPKKSWLLPTGSSHQVFLSMVVCLPRCFPRRGSSSEPGCANRKTYWNRTLWDFKWSVFLRGLAQHVRHWHKTQNSIVYSLGQHSSKFSLSCTVQACSAASPQTMHHLK